jgi:molybdopterin molybdotransferase
LVCNRDWSRDRMFPNALDDCFAHGERRLTHEEALTLLRAGAQTVSPVEIIRLQEAAGRRVAERITAGSPVPAHRNTAVDGYAFAFAAYDPKAGTTFQVGERAAAGHPSLRTLRARDAARVFTGAVMPEGSDTVAMQEDCTVSNGSVRIPGGLKPRANVRQAGEDVPVGTILFEPGVRLRPQDLAALASIGHANVACYRPLRIGLVATGDEVVTAGDRDLLLGEVFDTNTPMLSALVAQTGATVEALGIWRDDAGGIRQQLVDAAARFDVILTTGGASRGEEDHMASALASLGTRHFWQIAIKPGRPMMFGQIQSAVPDRAPCIIVGLPGNPVAVFVCYLMYVYPLLHRLNGGPWMEPRRVKRAAAFSFTGRKPGRREFWRGTTVERANDGPAVDKFARDGSGLISGLRAADGLIDIPELHGDIATGDVVDFIPFSEFGIIGG